MTDWLDEARTALSAASGVPAESLELDERTKATLLELARIAAHESGDRRNAPLLCYLLGVASHGAELPALAAAVSGEGRTEPEVR